MITVKKGDRERVITIDQLKRYKEDGYEEVVQRVLEPSAVEALGGPKQNLIFMQKNGRIRAMTPDYVEAYKGQGYVVIDKEKLDAEYLESREADEGEFQPIREGSRDSGDPEGNRSGPAPQAATSNEQAQGGEDLIASIQGLDRNDDSLWTSNGTPKVAAVSRALGRSVTQEEVIATGITR